MSEFEQRRRAVSEQLAKREVEALVVSSPANIRYLTGFAGSNALMLVSEGEAHFFTDPRYTGEAASVPAKSHVAKGLLILAVASIIKRKRLKKVGFEPTWMDMDQHGRLEKALERRATLHPVASLIEEQRAVKSPAEIAIIRRSVQANSEAYARTLKRIRAGLRELEIAAELEFQMKVLGSEKPAFDTIVAVGDHSALPHAHPTQRRSRRMNYY